MTVKESAIYSYKQNINYNTLFGIWYDLSAEVIKRTLRNIVQQTHDCWGGQQRRLFINATSIF